MFFIVYAVVMCASGALAAHLLKKGIEQLSWKELFGVITLMLMAIYTIFAIMVGEKLQYQPSLKQYYQSISKQFPSFTGAVECDGLNPVLNGTQRGSVHYKNNHYLVSYTMRYDQLTGIQSNSSWYALCPLGFVPPVNTVVAAASNITQQITATAEYMLRKDTFIATTSPEQLLISERIVGAIEKMEKTGQKTLKAPNDLQIIIENVAPEPLKHADPSASKH